MKSDIINNNYTVQSYFDSVPEGFVSKKHLSYEEAKKAASVKKNSYLTSFKVVEHLSIVGIVPFNSGQAYIFNKDLPECNSVDKLTITANTLEELMDCYVYRSKYISKKLLNNLLNEYNDRGGILYEEYHSFEDIELRKIRKSRQRAYRDNIVYNSIFKHGFREIGINRWSDGVVVIRQKDHQRSRINYPSMKTHTELNISKDKMILLGSLFGRYLEHINQLSGNIFGVVCNKNNNSKYHFTYFEVEFK